MVVLEFLLIILMVLANGIFAMSEIAVVSARKVRLQRRAGRGDSGARAALELAESPNRFLSTVQIGITLVGILAGAFGGATIAQKVAISLSDVPLVGQYGEALGLVVVVLGVTYLSLVLGELVPKRLALNNAEGIASLVARPMKILALVATPVVRILTTSTDVILRLLGAKPSAEPPITEEEIGILIEQGILAGVFQQDEHDIVERVLQLDTRRVGSIKTPRTEIEWLDIKDAPDKNWHKMSDGEYSYFPVCEGGPDRTLGIVSVKTVLAAMIEGQDPDLRSLIQPPLYVPESVPLLRLIRILKETGHHFVLVLGEHGDVDGLVTLKDVMEAIAGDLPSLEDESKEVQVERRQDGTWLIDGLLPLDEFRELFDIKEKLPHEKQSSYHTLGGLIMAYLGRIPVETDSFEWQGYRFEVVEMDRLRVDKVLVAWIEDERRRKSSGISAKHTANNSQNHRV